ncbi:MAG: zinc ribbon domain-containing protein [Promethearchaeota archaeon]|nr:MAG: zinc ribbon domain-containing protein [Candidatus Lokiarchaeota archaeon]
MSLWGSTSTCNAVLENQILLEDTANQYDKWKKQFIDEMKNYGYIYRVSTENILKFDKEWKKKIIILREIKDNDLWIHYFIKFHGILKLLTILAYAVGGLFSGFIVINLLLFGKFFPASYFFIPLYIFLTIFFTLLISFVSIFIIRQGGIDANKNRNENIIIDIRKAAKNSMKIIKKQKIADSLGKKRQKIHYCPNCGNQVDPDWNFCPNCKIPLT